MKIIEVPSNDGAEEQCLTIMFDVVDYGSFMAEFHQAEIALSDWFQNKGTYAASVIFYSKAAPLTLLMKVLGAIILAHQAQTPLGAKLRGIRVQAFAKEIGKNRTHVLIKKGNELVATIVDD